ncbi:hypothetical protein KAFR_0J00950 [Kazachstania africana CBS 2517]|uniref:peptide chain release factor N(5)-glutamine methyltransferase n=1 Tax=Kazachstania africana (strain ATCC 22294 / BCRC 22015 / CBS 2517 / CECT 1963 / NBRC 1671 / NRRL Y-8276) TaxID=1071382 RepID=H2B0L3_KAZAF|nr:hypothetical protein KAFR_0J00950 [Kazachstania africana CBS 2517]CCF60163.1 hypothetical protein KAFR_0J00950 [Kazachstania africana CBS 2517]
MPRISWKAAFEAARLHPCLPLLLRACRTVEQAQVELRWLLKETPRSVRQACVLRSRHVPLQYVIGTQPFGCLDIVCRRNVLIPRWETEEWTTELIAGINGSVLSSVHGGIKIYDLCSGTGCVPLLMKSQLQCDAHFTAIDVSRHAVRLIRLNLNRLFSKGGSPADFRIMQRDILHEYPPIMPDGRIDIVTCNPPYIRRQDFVTDVQKSVKLYEPKLALIGDLEFYQNLLDHWLPRTDSFVYEIGNMGQFDFISKTVRQDPNLSQIWNVGLKFDSNNSPRCVYGFKSENTRLDYRKIFQNFGNIMHSCK